MSAFSKLHGIEHEGNLASTTQCNHIVGTATCDYQTEMVSANDGDAFVSDFQNFHFCPYCGVDVDEVARVLFGRFTFERARQWDDHAKKSSDRAAKNMFGANRETWIKKAGNFKPRQ